MKQLPEMPAKSAKKAPPKNYKTHHIPPKCRAERFPNDFYASDDMLYCKFCQHHVDLKRVDMFEDLCWPEARVKIEENTVLHSVCGKIKMSKNSIPKMT